jgi:oligopeptide/dipeptide ABC transporter ATP-binding protein
MNIDNQPETQLDTLVSIKGAKVHFPIPIEVGKGDGLLRAVDGIDLNILKSESLGLVGESGSGKTTLGNTLLGLQAVTQGDIQYEGKSLTNLTPKSMFPYRRKIQAIFQDPFSSLHPRYSVRQIIEEPLEIHKTGDKQQRLARVIELLNAVGLSKKFAHRYPNELSGGQCQRVGIARALALEPDFIVADEAVSALDVSVQSQILNLLKKLQQEKKLTLLFIAHDLAVVEYLCDRVAVMYLGRIIELADTKTLFTQSSHPYTLALLSATLDWQEDPAERLEKIVLKGDMPSSTQQYEGCPFQSRCWYYQNYGEPKKCTTENPAIRNIGNNHWSACHFAESVIASEKQLRAKRSEKLSLSQQN